MTLLSVRHRITGNEFLQNIKKQKNVIIPDGVERIGDDLFKGSDVESV